MAFSNHFSEVATPGGSEMLVHQIQLQLDCNPHYSVLKTNISHTFNRVSQQSLLRRVKEEFPELYNCIEQMYGKPSHLIYINNQRTTTIIPSQEGVHQETLWVQQCLLQHCTQSSINYSDTTLLTYLDDIFIIGCSDHVVQVKSKVPDIGLSMCPEM